MEIKYRIWDREKVSVALNRGNKYKDYVNIFLLPNYVSLE